MLMSRKNISGSKKMPYICFDIYPDHRNNCHTLSIAHEVGDFYIFPAAVGDFSIKNLNLGKCKMCTRIIYVTGQAISLP